MLGLILSMLGALLCHLESYVSIVRSSNSVISMSCNVLVLANIGGSLTGVMELVESTE